MNKIEARVFSDYSELAGIEPATPPTQSGCSTDELRSNATPQYHSFFFGHLPTP
jgi:hypothetical protein